MNAPIDTLAFAERFETAGFGRDQARALAIALGETHDAARENLVTREHLDGKLGEFEARITKQLSDMDLRLTKQIGDNGKDLSNRLWSTVTIIAGVSTAISATVGAGVALLLKAGGL